MHNVREAPAFGERFTSQPAPTRVMQSVTIEGTGIDDEVMHRVANLLPTLAQVAFAACQPGLDHEVRSLGASRVWQEVVRTADVYAAAVADRRSPLQAVMDELESFESHGVAAYPSGKGRGGYFQRGRANYEQARQRRRVGVSACQHWQVVRGLHGSDHREASHRDGCERASRTGQTARNDDPRRFRRGHLGCAHAAGAVCGGVG